MIGLALLLVQEVVAVKVEAAPAVDADPADAAWDRTEWTEIETSRTDLPGKGKIALKLKVVHTDGEIFFLAQWADDTHDDVHKPYEWFERANKYVESAEKYEDQFSLAFPIAGEFTADMVSNLEAEWDVWQWGAARTPHGWARDRVHRFAPEKPKRLPGDARATEYASRDNKPLWIIRMDDGGTGAVRHLDKRPAKKSDDLVPQYEAVEPSGSCADVRARGVWKDGRWTLELSRAIDTKNKDDVTFRPGKELPFAAGIFDHDTETVHRTSKVLRLTWK